MRQVRKATEADMSDPLPPHGELCPGCVRHTDPEPARSTETVSAAERNVIEAARAVCEDGSVYTQKDELVKTILIDKLREAVAALDAEKKDG